MHCPACNHKFGFFRSLLIMNPFRIKCRACVTVLTMGPLGAFFLAAGFLLGFLLAEVAMDMKENGAWNTPGIVLWFVVVCPAVIGAYEWLGWRYMKLAIRKQARRF